MKRKAKWLILTLLLSIAVLTGCGKTTDTANDGKLSRGEYIRMLAEGFGYDTPAAESDIFTDVSPDHTYYPYIQAAAEWQVVDSADKFEPDKPATLGFALQSAVKAVDIEDIEAVGTAIDTNQLEDFYAQNIAQLDISKLDTPVDRDTAAQIIAYAQSYDASLVLPQVTEMELGESVQNAKVGTKLNADGTTGSMTAGTEYKVGDILYFDATDNSLARAVKITAVDGDSFTFEDASIEEAYSYLNIRGSFEGKVVEAVSASEGSNVGLAEEIYDEMKQYGVVSTEDYWVVPTANSVTTNLDRGKDHMVFTANYDVQASSQGKKASGKASSQGKLTVGIKDIQVDVAYESAPLNPLKPKEVKCNLHFNTEVSSEAHGSVGVSIPLGEAYIQVWGPLNIKVKLVAHVGADGNVSISYTTTNVASVGWKKGTGLSKSFNSTPKADFEADTTLTAEMTMLTDLRLGFKSASCSLLNAQVTSGAVAVGKTEADLLGDQPTCVDIQLYVPLKWGVNQEECLLTEINKSFKYSAVIWDSSSSPVHMHMHWEDWVRTPNDECTRKDSVEQEIETPEGEPLEEINPFDFELIDFDFIELDSYAMYLGEGESMNIGFESIPDGYSQADLAYEVEDASVCSVSGGTVYAKAPGSTVVRIKTKDGMFMVSLAVTVNDDYTVEGFDEL